MPIWKEKDRVLIEYEGSAWLGTIRKVGTKNIYVKFDDNKTRIKCDSNSPKILGKGIETKNPEPIPLEQTNDYREAQNDVPGKHEAICRNQFKKFSYGNFDEFLKGYAGLQWVIVMDNDFCIHLICKDPANWDKWSAGLYPKEEDMEGVFEVGYFDKETLSTTPRGAILKLQECLRNYADKVGVNRV